jgi:hypothetical protein
MMGKISITKTARLGLIFQGKENPMADENAQDVLNRILADLKSGDEARELAAIDALERVNFNSEAVLAQLERLALGGNETVRNAALRALSLKTSQFVASKRSPLNKSGRAMILYQIGIWLDNGLIEEHRAEVIQRRYDFDSKPGIPVRKAEVPPPSERQEQGMEAETAKPIMPAPVISEPPKPVTQPQPAGPRPSLTQILLSETSIRVYLYLGAFFVIASAAILAALVEAARLPILLVATLIFAGGAIGFKRRLPQPSFALAIVFSFLLPIDAGVMADMFDLPVRSNDFYWAGVFLLMTVIWGFGTWFYESRVFSLASFAASPLAVLRIDQAFDLSKDWSLFTVGAASLASLYFVRALQNWKDKKFAQPLFLSAHVLQAAALLLSLVFILINLFDSEIPSDAWSAHALTWLLAASFYAASDLLVPLVFFPWTAVASLFLVPWLFLSAFDASALTQVAGFGVWGALAAFTSEFTRRARDKRIQQYSPPLLILSLPLFSVAILWGLVEDARYAFAAFFGTGLVYTGINFLRPRWEVWSIALLAWLGSYFTFFALPFMQKTDVYFGYQLLIASLLLLLPELFSKEPLTFARSWNAPPVALGIILVSFNILFAHALLFEEGIYFSRAAVTLGVYALLFAAYAIRFRQPLIGYLATTSLALTVVYALIHFDLDLWLPSLAALSAVYYFAGYFLARNEGRKSLGAMLVNSGLALGMIFSTIAALTLKETGGWYALLIAALFTIEMFTRRNGILELFVMSLPGMAFILILNDFKVHEFAYYAYGLSLVWLAGDAVLHLTFAGRSRVEIFTRIAGGLAATVFTIEVLNKNIASAPASTCFAVYTAFFAAYALTYQKPALGYLSTASAGLTMFYTLDHFRIETWLPLFTGLSLAYYLAGFFLQKKSAGWSDMFRYSGLALGSVVSFAALIGFEPTGGWYAVVVGALFVVETVSTRNGWFEAGIHILFSIAALLILRDFKVHEESYILLAFSLVWLGGDVALHKTFKERKIANPVRWIGAGIVALNALLLLVSTYTEAAVCFGVYTFFFAVYALLYNQPLIGYASTVSLPLAVYFGLRAAESDRWLFPVMAIAILYYAFGFVLRGGGKAKWDSVLLLSGLCLGTITALLAPAQSGGIEKAIPIALAATLFAVEAFHLRNVWLAFPANILYLISYFTLLIELNVDEPQYFSIGAALLGMLMHYLLIRANSKTGAFIMGAISQLVLLGTSYIQLVSTSQVGFFFVLFFQSLVIIFYGLYMRSRSLVFAPIGIVVLATLTILYSALQNLSLVIIIGVSGLILLTLGILAVLMRERIASFVERFSDWNA